MPEKSAREEKAVLRPRLWRAGIRLEEDENVNRGKLEGHFAARHLGQNLTQSVSAQLLADFRKPSLFRKDDDQRKPPIRIGKLECLQAGSLM